LSGCAAFQDHWSGSAPIAVFKLSASNPFFRENRTSGRNEIVPHFTLKGELSHRTRPLESRMTIDAALLGYYRAAAEAFPPLPANADARTVRQRFQDVARAFSLP